MRPIDLRGYRRTERVPNSPCTPSLDHPFVGRDECLVGTQHRLGESKRRSTCVERIVDSLEKRKLDECIERMCEGVLWSTQRGAYLPTSSSARRDRGEQTVVETAILQPGFVGEQPTLSKQRTRGIE